MLDSLQHIEELDREMQNCIQNCLDCHSICLATAMHCLDMGGKHAAREHITTLLADALAAAPADVRRVRGCMRALRSRVRAAGGRRPADAGLRRSLPSLRGIVPRDGARGVTFVGLPSSGCPVAAARSSYQPA